MKKLIAFLSSALLAGMIFVYAGSTVKAAEPVLDISTAQIELCPQMKETEMHVSLRNMPEDTELGFMLDNPTVATAEWVDKDSIGYKKIKLTAGEALGDTVLTVFMTADPTVQRQIIVSNKEVASSRVYEGDGSMDIYCVNLTDICYQMNVSFADPNGYIGVIYMEDDGTMKVMVNQNGAYNGSVTLPSGSSNSTIRVLSTGHWSITLTPVIGYTNDLSFTGTGDGTTLRFRGDSQNHDFVCANIAAGGNFIVWLYDLNDDTKDLLCNGVGQCSHSLHDVYLNKNHSYVISVKSEGNWVITKR